MPVEGGRNKCFFKYALVSHDTLKKRLDHGELSVDASVDDAFNFFFVCYLFLGEKIFLGEFRVSIFSQQLKPLRVYFFGHVNRVFRADFVEEHPQADVSRGVRGEVQVLHGGNREALVRGVPEKVWYSRCQM